MLSRRAVKGRRLCGGGESSSPFTLDSPARLHRWAEASDHRTVPLLLRRCAHVHGTRLPVWKGRGAGGTVGSPCKDSASTSHPRNATRYKGKRLRGRSSGVPKCPFARSRKASEKSEPDSCNLCVVM